MRNARKPRRLLEEFGYIFAVRTLEQANVISPTDANLIASDAVLRVSNQSERMGGLVKSLNDMYIQDARK